MTTIFDDVSDFQEKFNIPLSEETDPTYDDMFNHRQVHLCEEFCEGNKALRAHDLDEYIDGLIDLIYVAAGSLLCLGIDPQAHWNEVHKCNMNKKPGVKASRPDAPYDVIKPEGWESPDHAQIRKNLLI